MTNTIVTNKTGSRFATYLKNYQPSNYLVDEIYLHVDLQNDFTLVKSQMKIRHDRLSTNPSHDLVLNGEELMLESLKLNGEMIPREQYEIYENLLNLLSYACGPMNQRFTQKN